MEHKYRKELQNRTIAPRKDAWAKLEGRLSDFEKSKKQKKWTFLKYAASILIIISVGVYFGQEKKQTFEKEIVAEPVLKVQENKIQSIVEQPQNVIAASENENSSVKSAQDIAIEKPTDKPKEENIAENHANRNDKSFQSESSVSEIQVQISGIDSLQKQKINEAVTQAGIIKKVKGEVSDIDIERLLQEAQKSLMAERKMIHNKGFNGADLLAEVEFDLDKDFKERLFKALVKTLKDPKIIFANREN
jgi:transcriptional regulator of acetoin/glycerol metabolism